MNEIIGRFSAILLIGLLLIKVSAFHVYEHHDDSSDDSSNHCELCVLILDGQQLEGIAASPCTFDEVSFTVSFQDQINSFEQGFVTSAQEYVLFSRPPPFILG